MTITATPVTMATVTEITATTVIMVTMSEALRTRIREILTSREAQQTLILEPIIQMPATTAITATMATVTEMAKVITAMEMVIPEITATMAMEITEITETMAMARRV